MRNIISLFLFISIFTVANAGKKLPPFLNTAETWADSVMQTMNLDQKIGQLIMVTTYPAQGENNHREMKKWISEYHVGGVLFLKSTPYEVANLSNQYQEMANTPLFIALDAENGLSFRLDSVVRYPHAMALGALNNDSLIYNMGREIGQQCRTLGINLNFAPVADVNSNPNNPIINYRSFGENPQRVAQKCWQLAKGMQDEGVLVTAKHFPGHGDTAFDSHHTLPTIDRNYQLLDSIDFAPFKTCIDNGISGIMTAHINMSGIDNSGLPATLSESIMTDILNDSLGFVGLVFSDGMNMKGITKHYTEGEAAVKALNAGVDVIEFVLNPDIVIDAVKKAIDKGEISIELINRKCKKVLLSKHWLGLNNYQPANSENLSIKINKPEYQLTARKLYEQTITVIKNHKQLVPLQRLDTLRIASLAIGKDDISTFQNRLQSYMEMDQFTLPLNSSDEEIDKVLSALKNYNLVIAGIHSTRLTAPQQYGITPLHKKTIDALNKLPNTIIAHFGNPYALQHLDKVEKSNVVLLTYGENYWGMDYAAQLIFGAIDNNSTLPVTINNNLTEGFGIEIKKNGRLKYTIPEEEGIDSNRLKSVIDSFVNRGISDTYFPGCQVLVAKNGKVIFHESYGHLTYENTHPLTKEHLYDWASISKIAGPLPFIMRLTEEKKIQLDRPFSNYWKPFSDTDKASITLREILTHQAGLQSWIPFHLEIIKDNGKFRKKYISTQPSARYPIRISSKLFLKNDFKQEMLHQIDNSELLKRKKYVYSDLGFLIFPDLISEIYSTNYEQLHRKSFILPIGATTVCYNPYRFYPIEQFVPTEIDAHFRKEKIQGFVQDETAALFGGVSGNAGLFGTTNDLAKIMQFYLNKGSYGDFCLFKPETFDFFNTVPYKDNDNRRALGFDKPYVDNAKKDLKDAYPAPEVSPLSFGHTGFSGSFAWSDPLNGMTILIMTNRTYPWRKNTRIVKTNFRPSLQQAIYKTQNTFEYAMY